MLRTLLFLIPIVFAISAAAQPRTELERRNGFKEIKLGMPIDSVKGSKFKKDIKINNEFLAKLYEVENPEYAKIGEVAVNKIELKTYKDRICEIQVITDKDPRLMKALESIYGLADYDIKHETYFWKGPTLILKFRSHSKNQLEMIYTSFTAHKLMKEDKGKKVQDIADDF